MSLGNQLSLGNQFGLLWTSQLISLIGSSLTGFVLGVWVYQTTGSATQFALIFLASVVPMIAVAPFAGVLADRVDRRRIMIVADVGAGLSTAAIAALLWSGQLEVWHIYLATATAAAFNGAHTTAFLALLPRLVPAEGLGRANGMIQMLQAAQVTAPLFAGPLLETIGLGGVIGVDLGTMAVGIALLVGSRLPAATTRPPESGATVTLTADLGHGWRYLRPRPGLFALALVFGAFNFFFAFAGVLVQPLILSFGSPSTLGVLMFVGGAGMFLGSLAMAVWGGPRRRVRGILIFLVVGGCALILHALRPSTWLVGIAAPLFLFTLPILNGTALTIVQTKVESGSLGRVIATQRMLAQSATPLAFVLAGPVADRVAEPMMASDGALAGSVGRLLGTGDGRGIALVFALLGAGMLFLAVVAASLPRLRRLEAELPDVTASAAGRHRLDAGPRTGQHRGIRSPAGRHRLRQQPGNQQPGNQLGTRPLRGDHRAVDTAA